MTDELPTWMTEGTTEREPLPQGESDTAANVEPPIEGALEEEKIPAVSGPDMAALQEAMSRDIRSWGKWLIGLGVLHLIAAGKLDASWGVMLVLLGAMSFLFTSPSMYVLYAVTMAWAGISNLLGDGWGWSIFALFQFYLTFKIARQYYFFRKAGLVEAEREAMQESEGKRPIAPRLFPWLGLVGSALLLLLLIILFVAGVVLFGFYEVSEESTATLIWEFSFSFTIAMTVVFWGMNLASIISKYRPRILAGLGFFFSTVTVILLLILYFTA